MFVLFDDWVSSDVTELGPVSDSVRRVSVGALGVDAHHTMEGIAACVVDALRAIQPSGPYRLMGISVGLGALAYEVAVQLLGADEIVEFVGFTARTEPDWVERLAALAGPEESEAVDRAPRGTGQLARALRAYVVPPAPLVLHGFFEGSADSDPRPRAWWSDPSITLERRRLAELARGGLPERWATFGPTPASPAGAPRGTLSHASVPQSRSLVTIQRSLERTASVFCVPGAGATIADFVPFGSALGAAYSVHGFQYRGMTALPHYSVEATARAYLRELRLALPVGPVHLVGHSFGGWVAFEMALLLQASGRNVRSLTLIDSECPGGGGRVGRDYTRPEALMYLVGLQEQAAEVSLGVTLGDFEALRPDEQLRLLHQRMVRVGLIPARSSVDAVRGLVRSFETAVRTKYVPSTKFNGSAELVWVPGTGEGVANAELRLEQVALGWRRVIGQLELRRGQGNHVTMLRAPNVGCIAESLKARVSDGQVKAGLLASRQFDRAR